VEGKGEARGLAEDRAADREEAWEEAVAAVSDRVDLAYALPVAQGSHTRDEPLATS
jgi:hypothetical protein